MPQWLPFIYGEFYDVPRVIVVSLNGAVYLFECAFDETRDDYSDFYEVYLLPAMSREELKEAGPRLKQNAIRHLGRVAVCSVRFDQTLRREIDMDVLQRLEETA